MPEPARISNSYGVIPDILYIFRKPQATYFSLERVFKLLAREINRFMPNALFYVPYARPLPLNLLYNAIAVRKQKAKVYHVTGDVHYVTLALPGNRTVLTIHDLAVMHRKTGLRRLLYKYLYLVWPVRHCRYITCISEKTRQDIINFTGCNKDRVLVIPNPIDNSFQYSPKIFNKHEPVILFIGTAPHKNLARAIEALKDIPCLLDIVGRIPGLEVEKLIEYKIKYRESFDLSDEELAAKYRNCDMVLFPSLFEGFGLPIIEAQQTGRPLITSSRSPMLDVAGAGACLVDPESAASIREGLIRVINDTEYREEICKAGCENVEKYSVEAIAAQYQLLYQNMMI